MSAPDTSRYATEPFKVDWGPKGATGYCLPHDGFLGQWIIEDDPEDFSEKERAYHVPVDDEGGIGEVVGVAPLAQVIELEARVRELEQRLYRFSTLEAMFTIVGKILADQPLIADDELRAAVNR